MINTQTVERLVMYNRALKTLEKSGEKWVTSTRLAGTLAKSPAQVRKDLSLVGKMGKPGVGYNTRSLRKDLDRIIGLDRDWGVAIIGAGNLGKALFRYPGFRREGFRFLAVFDSDPKKIGKKWGDVRIRASGEIVSRLRAGDIKIAVIAVPAAAAQKAADSIIESGIREILNFAPVALNVPEGVNVRNADLAFEMENLTFFLCGRERL